MGLEGHECELMMRKHSFLGERSLHRQTFVPAAVTQENMLNMHKETQLHT